VHVASSGRWESRATQDSLGEDLDKRLMKLRVDCHGTQDMPPREDGQLRERAYV